MPVRINEVHSEVMAFDASALLTEEVVQVLTRRIAEELARRGRDDALRDRDATIAPQRRHME